VRVWLPAAVAACALAWVVALAAAPVLPAPIAAVLYAMGSLICHQLPERSFHLQSFQLPVCARCFGLYAGGAAGSMAVAFVRPLRGRVASSTSRFLITGAAAIPTLATVLLEHGLGWPLSNETRALAAVPFAAAVAVIVVGAVPTVHYGECAPRRPIGHGQPQPPTRM
jgi:uncharacterized membrane protein